MASSSKGTKKPRAQGLRNPMTENQSETVAEIQITNVGLVSRAQKLQTELRTHQTNLIEVTQSIKKLNSRKRELESQMKLIKSELKQLSERESSLAEFGRNDFEWSQNMWHQLETVFKIKEFRSHQLVAINATMSKMDCVLVMPTGGGKSLCFQLPAILTPGITIVVSPLISLMEDQIQALNELKIPAAIFNSRTTKEEARVIMLALNAHSKSNLKLIYITPEKLAKSKRFMSNLEKLYQSNGFARLVIDEVHCCSQWGHDFRPDYKFLSIMKNQFPSVPILGLTATATTNVILDVQKMLNIESCIVFKDTFFRPTLIYEVLDCSADSKLETLKGIIRSRFKKKCGIIYCLTVKDTEEVAAFLREEGGIRASAYHAYLEPEVRSGVQARWYQNEINIIVATIAFGMGINKLDVEFVIHYSMSKSIENYYQESGRAGRDGRIGYCILLFSLADLFRTTQIMMTEKNGTLNVYKMLKYSLDRTTCRKQLMAEYFGDSWNAKDNLCDQCCDNCVNLANGKLASRPKLNLKQFVQDVVAIINHAETIEQRITLRKLLGAVYKKGGEPKLRVEKTKIPSFPTEVCEQILGRLILDGYLQEEFHFTPYSTISYIVPGDVTKLGLPEIVYEDHKIRTKSIDWTSVVRKRPINNVSAIIQEPVNNFKNKPILDHSTVKQEDNLFDNDLMLGLDNDLIIPSRPQLNKSTEGVEAGKIKKESLSTSQNKSGPKFKEELSVQDKNSLKVENTSAVTSNLEIEIVDLTDDDEPPPEKKFKFKKKVSNLTNLFE